MLSDYWKRYEDAPVTKVARGVERRIIHTDTLMLAVVDFHNGPASTPEPFHQHEHEQVAFVAEGELLLFAGDNEPVRLEKGDMYAMEPNVPHTIQSLTKHVRIVDSFTPLRNDFL